MTRSSPCGKWGNERSWDGRLRLASHVRAQGPGTVTAHVDRGAGSPREDQVIRLCILSHLHVYENESVRENELRTGRQRRDSPDVAVVILARVQEPSGGRRRGG